MPRVTKAQKEARAKHSGRAQGTGFKVGPSHAPRNAYLGKAQKKKAELIAAAKVKQQYAKVLAREGMQSVRVGGRKGGVSARGELPRSGEGKEKRSAKGKARAEEEGEEDAERARLEKRMAAAMADADDDDDVSASDASDSEDDSDAEDEAARAAARMREAAREADDARAERRERKAFERGQTGTEKAFRPGRRPKPKPYTTERRTVRALSPPKVEPREGRLRDLKRDAFGQRHSGRARGQPRMGARMDMLLEQIRRTK
ncbi:hypothetical protein CspeluHIS016_0503540 [Cutaneotrichosporon spelunceum]|uniref:rRNA-processing protein FYV7 n=1 Tax=Cutaneotrichosporon spelunceum TaxID=1672016 RepID=A0AAD3TWT6_9TREE|nr:hypothetical protein CspeluHIS016_0503540 [Cutaneotrichosporon spelunceum]